MASDTFLEMTRSLRLYVPALPITLAQQIIRDRYRRILRRRSWSAFRGQGQFLLGGQKVDGTVSVTFNSTSVVGTGTSFASSDVGRQFKAGTGSPVYTITAVADTTHLTLDEVFGSTTNATATYTIFDGYVTAPSDFLSFITVRDPLLAWRLRFWISQAELDAWDPQRTFFGNPYVLADLQYTSGAQTPMFEAWPYNASQRVLYYHYNKQGADLVNDTDTPAYPIPSDAIVRGALSEVSMWPGTKDNPNPYFGRTDASKYYSGESEYSLIDAERRDEDIYLTWLSGQDWAAWPFTPLSASFIQAHAI